VRKTRDTAGKAKAAAKNKEERKEKTGEEKKKEKGGPSSHRLNQIQSGISSSQRNSSSLVPFKKPRSTIFPVAKAVVEAGSPFFQRSR